MSPLSLFHYLLLNMFRMLAHPSSGDCDLCGFISCVVLLWFDVCWCYGVVRLGWCGILMQAEPEQYNTLNKSTISHKLLKMDVLTFETC